MVQKNRSKSLRKKPRPSQYYAAWLVVEYPGEEKEEEFTGISGTRKPAVHLKAMRYLDKLKNSDQFDPPFPILKIDVRTHYLQ